MSNELALMYDKYFFSEVEGGVKMLDIIDYGMPFGFLGRIAHWLFVREKLVAIFTHRYQVLEKLFLSGNSQHCIFTIPFIPVLNKSNWFRDNIPVLSQSENIQSVFWSSQRHV